jgi:peptidoglycan/xylan/chitin deacetylase (PgdA/CDA1 family)
VNISAKTVVAEALSSTGILRIAERFAAARGSIVFALHRVLPSAEMADCYNPYLALTPESFDAFLAWLKTQYPIVTIPKLLTADTPVCCLTFDDGWEDNFRYAFPLLQKHGVTATIFLAADLIGTDSMLPEERLWRLWQRATQSNRLKELSTALDAPIQISYSAATALLKQMPLAKKVSLLATLEGSLTPERPARRSFMEWEQVQAMHQKGIDFGSHSLRHAVLSIEEDSIIERELRDSLRLLEEHIQLRGRFLAYPNGLYDERVINIANAVGYEAAFTTQRGRIGPRQSRLELPRAPLDNFVTNDANDRFSAARTRLHLLRESWPGTRNNPY